MRLRIIHAIFFVSLIIHGNGAKKKKKHRSTSSSSDDSFSSFSSDEYWWDSRGDVSDENDIAFGGKLRRQFALSLIFQKPTDSVICSPVSALMPLGKLAFAASGKTKKEIFEAIGIKTISASTKQFKKMIKDLRAVKDVKIYICSALFISETDRLKDKFKKSTQEAFGSGVETVNFKNPGQAASRINKWVSSLTNNKINDLLKPSDVSPEASVILVNAIYFTGYWRYSFKTRSGTFHGPNGDQSVKMLAREEKYKYYESSSLGAKIIEIPYECNSRMGMVIVLPTSKDRRALEIVLKEIKVAPDLLKSAMKKMTLTKVNLQIPKFKIETKFDLGLQYQNIGLKKMFHGGLTKMVSTQKDLFVSKAVQSAIITVDEAGTTAGAASTNQVIPISSIKNIVKFVADRPFFFTIMAKDQQLFTGVYNG